MQKGLTYIIFGAAAILGALLASGHLSIGGFIVAAVVVGGAAWYLQKQQQKSSNTKL